MSTSVIDIPCIFVDTNTMCKLPFPGAAVVASLELLIASLFEVHSMLLPALWKILLYILYSSTPVDTRQTSPWSETASRVYLILELIYSWALRCSAVEQECSVCFAGACLSLSKGK